MLLTERLVKSRQAYQEHKGEAVITGSGWPETLAIGRPSNRQIMRCLQIPVEMLAECDFDDEDAEVTGDTDTARWAWWERLWEPAIRRALDYAQARGVDTDAHRGDLRDIPAADADPTSAPALYKTLSLLDRVADHRALSINYRVLILASSSIYAAAPWGTMRVDADIGLEDEVCVDAADFLGILKHAPNQPFHVTVRDNAMHWQCGKSRGRLGLIEAQIPVPDFGGDMTPLSRSFGTGLDLGGMAGGNSALLRNAGLEGVQVSNRGDRAYAVASDGIVVSSCCLGPALPMSNGAIVTLKPQSADLLAEVVKRQTGPMHIGVDDNTLYFLANGIELHINQLAPLPVNFAEKLQPYTKHKLSVPLLHDTVTAFLKRAELLAEVKREAVAEVTHKDGRTVLKFSEAANSTEDYYDIISSGPGVTVPPIRIEVQRLAKVLKYASHLVFDHVQDNVLILRGDNEFIFGIYGQPP